jgi:hypothetical protein
MQSCIGTSILDAPAVEPLLTESLNACGQVLLSFEVLGNPVASISTLGTGVRDFFVEPAQGMTRGVRDFGTGLGAPPSHCIVLCLCACVLVCLCACVLVCLCACVLVCLCACVAIWLFPAIVWLCTCVSMSV